MDNKTAIGNDKTKKLGRLYISACKACNIGRPYSTIFLIKSNITPTEREITVKAEIANNIGGIIWPNNHLSINGIEYQGEIIRLIVLLISGLYEDFKWILFDLCNFYQIINY